MVSLEAIAERLELTREALGFRTQVAFVEAVGCGLTPQKWNNYLAGMARLPVPVALEMCKKFRLSLDWIYRGDPAALPVQLYESIKAAENLAKMRQRRA